MSFLQFHVSFSMTKTRIFEKNARNFCQEFSFLMARICIGENRCGEWILTRIFCAENAFPAHPQTLQAGDQLLLHVENEEFLSRWWTHLLIANPFFSSLTYFSIKKNLQEKLKFAHFWWSAQRTFLRIGQMFFFDDPHFYEGRRGWSKITVWPLFSAWVRLRTTYHKTFEKREQCNKLWVHGRKTDIG